MNETVAKNQPQIFANLAALRQEMEKMAVKTKRPSNAEREQRQEAQGLVLVIRGK